MQFDAKADGRPARVEVRQRDGRYLVRIDDRVLEVDLDAGRRGFLSLLVDRRSYEVGLQETGTGYTAHVAGEVLPVELRPAAPGAASPGPGRAGPVRLTAPMPGRILRVLVEVGQQVEGGQGLMVMEAMKMENELRSPQAGTVRELGAREGQAVETGTLLALLE